VELHLKRRQIHRPSVSLPRRIRCAYPLSFLLLLR
jgi:hypothetical protein